MTPNDVLYVYQAQIWWKSGFFDQPRTFHVVITPISLNIIDKWSKWRRMMGHTSGYLDESALLRKMTNHGRKVVRGGHSDLSIALPKVWTSLITMQKELGS